MKKSLFFIICSIFLLSFVNSQSPNIEIVDKIPDEMLLMMDMFRVTSDDIDTKNDKGIPLDVLEKASQILIEEEKGEYFVVQGEGTEEKSISPELLDTLMGIASKASNATIGIETLPSNEFTIQIVSESDIGKFTKTVYKASDYYPEK